MLKVSVNNLKPGMKLAKPVINEAGIMLLEESTELTAALIDRLQNMNVSSVFIEGASKPQKSKEEIMLEIDARFRKTENEPYMGMLKRMLKEHVEELYK